VKKIMLFAAGIALLGALIPAVVLAGPPSPPNYGTYNPTGQPDQPPEWWGVEKVIPIASAPGGVVRIITDPLVGIGSDATGWVTFWCQSNKGFQYNIGATGLNRLSTHSVKAYGARINIVQGPGVFPIIEPEPGLWIDLSTAIYVELDLGTFKTDANSLGGVKGVSKLPSGPYIYDVAVVVSDSNGVPVLGPAAFPPIPGPFPYPPGTDTNGFMVY
jgi:hypothetical protein